MLRETIGPYRLETLLGRGGVGAVWRARHSTSGQCVALKTLESPVAAFLPTIRREVAALGQLRHRGIVRVLDSGSDGGLPWVAMELVEGPNLRVHVSQAVSSAPAGGERGLKPVLSVLRRLCEALAYLHGEGLVHRDLKPENVVVRADGQPVLVDFGLAARFGGGSSRETLALEAEPSGTLLYMAPEQLRGEMIDARADLYSLGCILYELLAGRPPFAGRSAAKLVQAHLHEAPVPAAWVIPVPSKSLEALVLRLLEKRPSHRLGHADDVAAALASLGAEAGPTGPRARPYLYRPELGGRQTILDAFETQFERLEGGAGGLVLLGGESGVGKSRLALELARRAERRGLRVLTGECQPLGLSGQATASGSSGPLHPLRKALQTIADRCRAFGADEAERLLGRRAKLLALYEPALDDLAGLEAHPEPAELPAQAARLRLYTFLTETFKALADDTATVLLLDDLQWADELTLGWLEYHLRSTGSTAQSQAALLVVGTYRTEEVVTGSLTPSGDTPASLLHPLLEAPGTVRLKLGRLEEAAVGQMVSEMLALEPAPLAFVRFLYRHSEGNPFFVAEYLRVAIAEGLLFRSEGFWRVAQGNQETPTESLYEALPLPRSLRETVQRRLLTLSAGAQELASAAAVLGRDMEASLLLAVAGTEAGKGLESLEELRAREVLEESAAGLFRFAHDKLREVAYERIGPGPRRVLHRAAAEAIEASRDAASIPVQDQGLATLGHHWEQAGADNKARDCYLAAARSAKNRNALNDAHELYRAYLRLVEQESTESIEARNEVAYDVLYPQGSLHEAKVLLEEALALARQTRATLLEATLLGNLGWLHNQQAELEEAWSLYEQGLGAARQAGDGLGEGTALNRMGVLRKDQGRMQDANSFYEQALAVALRIGDLRLEEAVLGNLGWLRSEEGRIEEAWALYERGLALARQTANRPHEGMMLGRMAVICHYRGKIELSLALQEQALRIQREVGNPRNVGRSLGNMGVLYYEQGRLEEAWDLLDQTLGVQRRVSDRVAEVLTLGNLGLVRAAQGRADEARTLIEDALALSRLLRNRPIEGASLGYLARVLGELGQVVEAMRVGAEALAIHREGGNHRLEAWVLADRARQVRRTSPHPGEALELALEAADAFRSSGRDLLPLAIAEQGHALLAAGHSCATALLEVRNLCREFGRTDPASECGHALARLERAQAAFEAGQALFRGEVWEDIPDALRRWLTETGHVDKIFAPHRSGMPSER